MGLYYLLTVAAVCLAFATGYVSLSIGGAYEATAEDVIEINLLKQNFQRKVSPVSIMNFNALYFTREQFQLINPVYLIAEDKWTEGVNYASSKNCFKNFDKLINERNFEKIWIWEEYRCKRKDVLPLWFFTEAPFIHPAGISFAKLAASFNKEKYRTKNWLLNHLSYFHARELKDVKKEVGQELRGSFRFLEKMSESTLAALSKGKGTILTKDFLYARLVYPNEGILEYRIYKREDLEDFITSTSYSIKNYRKGVSCFYRDGALCWNYNTLHLFSLAKSSTLIVLGGLILIIAALLALMFSKIRGQRVQDEKRRMALRILTHELRTPISSMLLLLERLKKSFDSTSEQEQEDFLRLSSDVYRLQRMTEMSQNYLKTKKQDQLINYRPEEIESVNELFLDIIRPFQEEHEGINLNLLNEDSSFCLDLYWTRILFKNLIENALTHGEKPIDVSLCCVHKKLEIEIKDQGIVDFTSLKEMSEEFVKGNKSHGTGLGLNIVEKVVGAIGGEFHFKKNPTRFSIVLKNKGEINE